MRKHVINRMEEQIKRISYPKNATASYDDSEIPAPLLENIRQYKAKISQKKKIWLLIIVNILAGIAINMKNFFVLYNGRKDCRYIPHGDDDYNNGRDVADASLVFVTKLFNYYLPIIVPLFVFSMREEDMRVFEKEEYYEEGYYTTALGMKPRRVNSEDWDDQSRQKNSEYSKSPSSYMESIGQKNSKYNQRNIINNSVTGNSKSINAISPSSGEI